MDHAPLILTMFLLSCSPSKPACTPEARDTLLAAYNAAVDKVIDAGACDKYAKVDACPAYMAVEAQYSIARGVLCQ
jgi:hypothetical protein